MTTPLTSTQQAILAYALEHTDGRIEWFPASLKGGARKKVLDSLFNRALITTDGTDWFVAAEGYDAMQHPRPGSTSLPASGVQSAQPLNAETQEFENAETGNTESGNLPELIPMAETCTGNPAAIQPKTRQNSKQARVIALLSMPEGTTISQICTATGWQAHTVRGMLSGVFKKKLGLTIVSVKTDAGDRSYRIA